MASDAQDSRWPVPKFHFQVRFGDGREVAFQEVRGLDVEPQVIEYRHGNSPTHSTVKMPGLLKVGNVTMRKGVVANDSAFWSWHSAIKMNTSERGTVVISLLDETGAPTMTWTLHNAWPTKVSATDLRSDGNEVAIESIELAFERLIVTNA